jgi:Flp pilus assembly protein TadG
MTIPANPFRRLAALARSLRALMRDTRGNVLMMMGLLVIPLVFVVGFGLDYGRAMRSQTKLAAIADSAALLVVSPAMMGQSDSAAVTAATAYFNAQASNLAGVTVSNLVITAPTATSGALAGTRTGTVTFQATSQNLFSTLLGANTLAISGTAKADASQPPSMNFYVALDTSPSMLLPTTSAGITAMLAGARWQGERAYYSRADGCAFACHANNNHQWNQGIYVIDSNSYQIFLNNGTGEAFFRVSCSGNVYNIAGTQIGNTATIQTTSGGSTATYCANYGPAANPVQLKYKPNGSSTYTTVSVNFPDTWWFAQNNRLVNPSQADIVLRTDAQASAAASLIQYAYNFQQTYSTAPTPPVYKLQFFTMNIGAPAALSTSPFGTMTAVSTLQSSTFPDLGAQAPLLCAVSYWTSCSTYTANADTAFTAALTGMQTTLPASAGSGTAASPQNVLILITDGAEDSQAEGMGWMTDNGLAKCTAIKTAGTRIAILYTEYRTDTINNTLNPTFNNFATGKVPTIQSKLQSCASTNDDGSSLMQTVSTDGDISAALNKLFAMTVRTARLLK